MHFIEKTVQNIESFSSVLKIRGIQNKTFMSPIKLKKICLTGHHLY